MHLSFWYILPPTVERHAEVLWFEWSPSHSRCIYEEDSEHFVATATKRWQSSISIVFYDVTLYCVALVSLNSRTIRAHSSALDLASPITPFADFKVDDPWVLCRSLIRILQSNFMPWRQLPVVSHSIIKNTLCPVKRLGKAHRSIGRDREVKSREHRSIRDDTAVWIDFLGWNELHTERDFDINL